jgi:hypothetical protein
MGNEASTPKHEPDRVESPTQSVRSEHGFQTPNSGRIRMSNTTYSRHNDTPSDDSVKEKKSYIDPVMAAAAAGAAAKRAKEDKLRRKVLPSPQTPFQIEVDNEWKASLRRFASSAASTARTVRSVAAPVLAEAAEAYHQVSSSSSKKQLFKTEVQDEAHHKTPSKSELSESKNNSTSQALHDGSIVSDSKDIQSPKRSDRINLADNPIVQSASVSTVNQQFDGLSRVLDKNRYELSEAIHREQESKKDPSFQQGNTKVDSIAITGHRKSSASEVALQKQPITFPASSPAVFRGDNEHVFPGGHLDQSFSSPLPNSMHVIQEKYNYESEYEINQGFRRKKTTQSETELSSVASQIDDSNRMHVNFSERQQKILDTPKQFVELVSKKLSEHVAKNQQHSLDWKRVGNEPFSTDSTPAAMAKTLIQSGAQYLSHTALEHPIETPSLSPPGSPISAAKHFEFVQKPQTVLPIVTLWDMVPSNTEFEDSIPDLVSEKGGNTPVLQVAMLKKQVIFELPREDFLMEETVAPSLANDDFELKLNDSSGTSKSKRYSDTILEVSSLHSGSVNTEESGNVVKPHRKKLMKRRKRFGRSASEKKLDQTRARVGRAPGTSSTSVRLSRSMSPDLDNSLRRKRLLELDGSGLFAEADSEDQNEQLSDTKEMLNEALLTYSNLSNMSLANVFPMIDLPDTLEYIASIRWRQLLANWKHQGMIEYMMKKPTSIHFCKHMQDDIHRNLYWGSSVTTTSADVHSRKQTYILFNEIGLIPDTKNLSGLAPCYPIQQNGLSEFIKSIGAPPNNIISTIVEVNHNFDGEVSVETLLHMAGEKHCNFSRLINRLAVFASQDYNPSQLMENEIWEDVSYSVDIKDSCAIHQKANKKYGGNLKSVKDILRAQIVFPNESSLVCGLIFLNEYSLLSQADERKAPIVKDVGLKAEIVRIKNLFATAPNGDPCYSCLPTGYRHLLLNIRIDDELLAGKL